MSQASTTNDDLVKKFKNILHQNRERNPEEQAFTLKDFEMGIQIGAGAFGIVWRVTHKTTKAQLALKSYNKKNLSNEEVANSV